MEWWSNGVMKGLIQVEIRALAFANTPILQYSKTAHSVYPPSNLTLAWPKVAGFRDYN
jgi:hypothetical protein